MFKQKRSKSEPRDTGTNEPIEALVQMIVFSEDEDEQEDSGNYCRGDTIRL